jgi:hypothetical protein
LLRYGFTSANAMTRIMPGDHRDRDTAPETPMRVGLFYQIQVPKPWTATSESERIYEALEQVPDAEQQGFESVWFSEHHFSVLRKLGEQTRIQPREPCREPTIPNAIRLSRAHWQPIVWSSGIIVC